MTRTTRTTNVFIIPATFTFEKSGTSMDCVEALKGLQARDDGGVGVPIFLR